MRHLIKANSFLYQIWYHLYRKHRLKKPNWFSKDSAFYLTGYPRSSNTFSTNLVRRIWPDLNFVHHLHVVAPIKIALSKNVKTFVLFRDPLDSISSYYLYDMDHEGLEMNREEVLKRMADDYNRYYGYVVSRKEDLILIHFTDMVKQPLMVMQLLNAHLRPELRLPETELQDKLEEALQKKGDKKRKLGASKSNSEKEKNRDIIKNQLRQLPVYDECRTVYDSLQAYYSKDGILKNSNKANLKQKEEISS